MGPKPKSSDGRSAEPETAPAKDGAVSGFGYQPGFGLPDDRILGEVSHELGNYFHKLHYWIDFLKAEVGAKPGSDESGLEMLEDTTERLEGFLRMTLEYLSPPRVSFDRIRIDQLIEGVRRRLKGRRLVVEGADEWAATEVMIDVSRMTHVVRTVVDRVSRTLLDKDAMTVALHSSQRDEFEGVEIVFVAGHAPGTGTSLVSGIEMAVAEKCMKVHGGEMFERSEGETGVVLFLPFYV